MLIIQRATYIYLYMGLQTSGLNYVENIIPQLTLSIYKTAF